MNWNPWSISSTHLSPYSNNIPTSDRDIPYNSMNNRDVANATRSIIRDVGEMYQDLKIKYQDFTNWWHSYWYKTQSSRSEQPSQNQEDTIDKASEIYNKINQKVNGSDKNQTSSEKNKKRSVQQPNLGISDKQYLSNSSEAKWDQLSLCGSGKTAMIAGATTNQTNATHPNEQRIQLFNITNNVFQRMDAVSTAIAAQFPPRHGQNNITSSCRDGYFHIITADAVNANVTNIFHTAIANQTLSIPQYFVGSYFFNGSFAGKPWRPITLLGNGCAFAPINGSTGYFSYTNSSGMFSAVGINVYPLSAGESPHREMMSYTDGTSAILDNHGDNYKLYIPIFDQFFGSLNFATINFNNQTIKTSIINELYAPKTPLVDNLRPMTLIAPASNYTSAALLTSIPDLAEMNSSRMLAPNSGTGPGAVLSIANCADLPDIYAYARDALDIGEFAIKYDVVNASLNSSSVIGGEQTYNNFTLSVPAQPQIACLDNGTIIIAYLENGRPVSFTFNFLGSNASSTPTPTPSPTPSPAALSNVTIDVTIPPNLGPGFIPITSQIVAISNNTATIQLVDTNGFTIVYTVNSSAVPLFTNFTPNEIYTFSIANNGNATKGSAPTFRGCDLEGHCSTSIPKPPLQEVFSTSGVNLALIIPLALVGVIAICIPGGIWYTKVILPRRLTEKTNRDWVIQTPASSPNPLMSKPEVSRENPYLTKASPSNTTTSPDYTATPVSYTTTSPGYIVKPPGLPQSTISKNSDNNIHDDNVYVNAGYIMG